MKRRPNGFTLIELIAAMVVAGILATILVTFVSPAMSNYFASERRAALSDAANGTMRLITRDVRASVPMSVRILTAPVGSANQCLGMAPSSAGGRYRIAPDVTWDAGASPANASQPVQPGFSVQVFDVFTPLANPAVGDWVLIGNQSTSDVYNAANHGQYAGGAAAVLPNAALGQARIALSAAMPVPAGYDGNRFFIVPAAQGVVAYVCDQPGTDAKGTGTGTLYRVSGLGFNAPGTCPAVGNASPIVATHVASCSFRYDPNPGATQESGYVEVDLSLKQENEIVRLTFGAHVENLP
jgi:MSHA biogenesis protein MshO